MRWVVRGAFGLAVIGLIALAGLWLFRMQIGGHVYERMAGQLVGVDQSEDLDDGLHVYLCGTGSPLPDADRAGPCVGVLAGRMGFVFDTGSGSIRNLARMGFPVGETEHVYFTHLHSDHIDGLGELMLQAWVGGSRSSPVEISGPVGITPVVDGFIQAYRTDAGYRIAHHGEDIANPAGFGAAATELDLPPDGSSRVVFDAVGARVSAFLVDHSPVSPAFGYRVDYAGRSVTISGDTVKSEAVASAAAGTDLLIHEALNREMVATLADAAASNGDASLSKIFRDILDYHASPVEAAETAQDAGVRELVFTHMVPPLPNKFLHAPFLEGVDDAFNGRAAIGEDGLMISLPAGSDRIVRHKLLD
ncbi:MBL fold metallo-hydrolase [Henriciella marina]|uniref:MBL fold metallo-hydrolase n=1 Tax=Henriciella marina TaxID=453851 RepID=UPI00058B4EA4|nr:MBL fold metallo-hydrolase [Henriciella marina]